MRVCLVAILVACHGKDDSGGEEADACAQPEICDEIDDDCDGDVDEGLITSDQLP